MNWGEPTTRRPLPARTVPAAAAQVRALRLLVARFGAEPAPAGTWLTVTDSDGALGRRIGPRIGQSRGPAAGDADLERIQALVTLAQGGDSEAFALIYERYVDVVYRYVYYRVGSHHLAEDLTSETFVRALRRLDSFTWTGRDIAAWFVTIARNIVYDHTKSSRYKLEISTAELLDGDERAPSPEAQVLDRLRDERLVAAMRGLKPDQQECIALRFLQGLSLVETADAMGRSTGAIKQLQLRAMRSLQRQLAGQEL